MEKQRKILILATIVIVTGIILGSILFGLYNKEKQEKGCLKFGGKWGEVQKTNYSGSYRECRDISAPSCEMIGGKFNGCASDCRSYGVCFDRCTQSCEFRGSAMFPFLLSDSFQEIFNTGKYYYNMWKWW